MRSLSSRNGKGDIFDAREAMKDCLVRWLADVSMRFGFEWASYQDYLVREGIQETKSLDFASAYSEMSYSWEVKRGQYWVKMRWPKLNGYHLSPYTGDLFDISNGQDSFEVGH